ncbi:L-ribulose-5-phosphate 3-epimerase (plasmid) [Ligilactobacillus salivarius]|uniref:L-ribulose-5-phosphate 3-epimerase n=1 Tax=Ligilactobacillus salivarius TaxID=1624 RepID=A0ABD7YXD1_9LACO|nr:L-ribulose-5-phosphate 3-epimerase [Ligilactobacillus salivarius]WHS05056.1 L-ribulose-5-phosphate 3-epimerase [Ligilactobacillus salivarius]WHS09143.1 L-ribulose-5-phosphate 3-epimerase [Ligilactobacillus salivarius]WHS11166.1 L-ribulose-5-phosphate 3-epimerase [Ligilactobacillus salivarius]WHS15218.1 L-ribulose-5-phosphate 3-epimerase [Ligilactobacillus salivarius]WHS18642.1 L-ribulose-5-phosphate 3-epimerase [Ligilactobacillus salivarius]
MISLGIYEKALPDDLSWNEKLLLVKELGFNYLELSVDESDEKLARLNWEDDEIKEVTNAIKETNTPIYTLMLSGHRRYPLGSSKDRDKSIEMAYKAIDLARKIGIRNIQLAGYDVYYEKKSVLSNTLFLEGLQDIVNYAASSQVMLAIETMDDPFINSITKVRNIKKQIKSPWLQAYPDLGNISAWPQNNIINELAIGFENIVSIHLKDTLQVSKDFPGKFKNVDFGTGCVDFKGCLKFLNDMGYSGTYTIEMWNQGNNSEAIAKIKEAKLFFEDIFDECGIVQRRNK